MLEAAVSKPLASKPPSVESLSMHSQYMSTYLAINYIYVQLP